MQAGGIGGQHILQVEQGISRGWQERPDTLDKIRSNPLLVSQSIRTVLVPISILSYACPMKTIGILRFSKQCTSSRSKQSQ